MSDNEIKPKTLLIAILLVVIVVVYFVWIPRQDYKRNVEKLSTEGKYTVGYVYNVKNPYRSNPIVYYYYYYNGKKNKGLKSMVKYKPDLNGEKFYVKFLSDNYKFSDILLNKPVKMEGEVPSKGWDQIPESSK